MIQRRDKAPRLLIILLLIYYFFFFCQTLDSCFRHNLQPTFVLFTLNYSISSTTPSSGRVYSLLSLWTLSEGYGNPFTQRIIIIRHHPFLGLLFIYYTHTGDTQREREREEHSTLRILLLTHSLSARGQQPSHTYTLKRWRKK